MNKETIASMLGSGSASFPNGEGRGGKAYFTQSDAVFCVSGMPGQAWDYMQYVDCMIDEMFMVVSSQCGMKIILRKNLSAKDQKKIQLITEIALRESRSKPLKNTQRIKLIQTSQKTWYRKYSELYAMALSIYSNLDNQANYHIQCKLGNI